MSSTVLHVVGGNGLRLFGLTTGERLLRQFARCGIQAAGNLAEAAKSDTVILVGGDAVIDQPLATRP